MKRPFRIGLGLAVLAVVVGVVCWLRPWGRDSRPGDPRAIERLKSLPYATWTAVGEQEALVHGVVRHERGRAWPGVNLYSSETEPGAFLLDMEGEILLYLEDSRRRARPWKLIEAVPPDRFAALAADGEILLVDRRGRILWERRRTFHHDFEVEADGTLWAIDRRVRRVPQLSRLKPVRDDHLVAISAEGRLELEVSSVELLLGEPELLAVAESQRRPALDLEVDVFHTNTITPLPYDVVRDGRVLFEAGDLLTCWRNLDTVAVVDPRGPDRKPRLRWFWGPGEIEWPHHPTLVEGGNLLIFDNGTFRGWSRVIELDPVSGEIVWEYRGDPPESFFTSSRGSAQRLPNGNTLITDSMSGRVFEVTPGGEIVWEFVEPRTRERWRGTERATIYRMTRLPEWPLPAPSREP